MNDTILDLLAQRGLKAEKISGVDGGEVEYASPCPKCGGTDRFRVVMNPREQASGHWWCRGCTKGGDIQAFLQAFGEPQPGTVVVNDAWSFLKKFPVVPSEEATPEELIKTITRLTEYVEAGQAEFDRVKAAGIESMRRAELAEERAEKLSEKLASALKVNAAGQMEAAVKLFTGLSAAMTGEEPPADLTVCFCPHCGKQMKTLAEAAEHVAVCEKHPAVIAAVAAEGERDWLAEKLGTLHADCPLKHIKKNPLGWKCHEGAQGPCTKAQAAACWKEAATYGVKEKSEGD